MKINFSLKYIMTFVIIAILISCKSKNTLSELPPPNIVWLVSEDNSMHYLKMFDDNGVATPNIEGLATQTRQ